MFDFNDVKEVSLGGGAHQSPEQGMCFMEMAAWFAGEDHSDEPDCACPVLGRYGIGLNDQMPDGARNELLRPLVPVIVGTKDASAEQARAEFLAKWAVNKIAPIALGAAGLTEHARKCENALTIGDCKDAARDARAAVDAADARAAVDAVDAAAYAYAAARAAADAAAYAAARAARAAAYAAAAARAAADAADADARAADARAADARAADARAAGYAVWEVAVEGLRQAIQIGKHEPLAAHIDWSARHEALKSMVAA